MQVKGGRVVEGKLHFQTMVRHRMGFNEAPEKGNREAPCVFPRNDWGWLRDLMPGPRTGTIGMQRRMEQLDTQGAVALVEGLDSVCSVPQVVDARQGLVVVLGNLDELYALGEEPLPELDPDVLLARHAELGLTGVQEALHGLFRIEQVARLGTDHFIFPPLGREALLSFCCTQVAATVVRLKETLTMHHSGGWIGEAPS